MQVVSQNNPPVQGQQNQIPSGLPDCFPQFPTVAIPQLEITCEIEISGCAEAQPEPLYAAVELRFLHYVKEYSDFYGAKYLYEIYLHPNQPINCTNIRNLFNTGSAQKDIDMDSIEAGSIRQFTQPLVWSVDPEWEATMPVFDEQAILEIRQEHRRLQREIAQATEWNDYGRLEDLLSDMEALNLLAGKQFNRFGKSRSLLAQSNRDYQTVTKAIKLFISKMDEEDAEVADYIRQHYRSGKSIVWVDEKRL